MTTFPQRYTDGDQVLVTDAAGAEHEAVARSDVEGRYVDGVFTHDMPSVLVEIANTDGKGTGLVPWPATAVRHAN